MPSNVSGALEKFYNSCTQACWKQHGQYLQNRLSYIRKSAFLIKILGLKRKMGLGFSPMVLCVVQRLCALTFFRPYRTLHLLLILKAEISHEHCERTVVFLEPLSFCQQREVTKSSQLKSRCV